MKLALRRPLPIHNNAWSYTYLNNLIKALGIRIWVQSKEGCGACLEEALAHASPGSAHQAIQAEVVVGVKFGLHDVEGALCCSIQAHEAAHVIQGQAILAVVAHICQHLTEGHHTCAAESRSECHWMRMSLLYIHSKIHRGICCTCIQKLLEA